MRSTFFNLGKAYLAISAVGAGIGGALGVAGTTIVAAPIFLDSIKDSEAKTMPGKLAEGIEQVGRFGATAVGRGMFFGGAPITYPMGKLWEHTHEVLESKSHSYR